MVVFGSKGGFGIEVVGRVDVVSGRGLGEGCLSRRVGAGQKAGGRGGRPGVGWEPSISGMNI